MGTVRVIGAGLREPFVATGYREGTTVEEVLEMSGADTDGLVIFVNKERCEDLSRVIRDGDRITFASSVKGA